MSSSYYYDTSPGWVNNWNSKAKYTEYANTSWELTNEISEYIHGEEDDMPYETNFPGYGVVFPHNFGAVDGKYFTTFLTLSPVGDELTLDFAKELINAENIGSDDITDYLSVSFSSTDYVGHVSYDVVENADGELVVCGTMKNEGNSKFEPFLFKTDASGVPVK